MVSPDGHTEGFPCVTSRLPSDVLCSSALIPAALVLTACGGSSSGGGASPSTSASAKTSTSTSASAGASSAASPSPTFAIGDGPAPTVTGAFDTKPTVVLPSDKPSDNLVIKTVIKGTGAPVKKGDLLVADYQGQIWDTTGKVFDSSYTRGVPASFPIGLGQVIPGWDDALVGVNAGSRVVLVVPPGGGLRRRRSDGRRHQGDRHPRVRGGRHQEL